MPWRQSKNNFALTCTCKPTGIILEYKKIQHYVCVSKVKGFVFFTKISNVVYFKLSNHIYLQAVKKDSSKLTLFSYHVFFPQI